MPVTSSTPARQGCFARRPQWLLAACTTLVLLAGCQTPMATEPGLDATALTDADETAPDTDSGRPAVARASTAPTLPVDIAADDAFACCLRANLWDRIRAGFRMDLTIDNDRIAAQRNWYVRNQAYLDRVVARASRYMHYIVVEAEARDMPLEMALLPIVESAFDPYAYSVAHAAGPWQFIPSTGRIYGMHQDWWYDGRRDVEKSTAAALDYLSRLSARFDGDYAKGLASYNAGAGTVSRAITKNLRAGKKTDYWSLPLPQETRAYVPKLIALAQIVQDPAKYGVRLNPIPDEPRFVVVEIGRQIDMARAAELADMPLTELYLYNPAHSRWVTNPDGPRHLLVPIDVADRFRQNLAATADEDYAPAVEHTVAEAETLESIAQAYNVTADSIRMSNDLDSDTLAPGATLRVPQPRLLLAAIEDSYEPRIAGINIRAAARGTRGSAGSVAGTGRETRYTVRRGDTLSRIADKFNVGTRELASWNRMKVSKPLKVGQKLVVRGGNTGSARAVAAEASSSGKRVKHKVRRGETLYGVARKFSVSVHDIARWNDFSTKRELRAGEVLKIFRD